jgi:hypothetical protein
MLTPELAASQNTIWNRNCSTFKRVKSPAFFGLGGAVFKTCNSCRAKAWHRAHSTSQWVEIGLLHTDDYDHDHVAAASLSSSSSAAAASTSDYFGPEPEEEPEPEDPELEV